MLLLCLGEEGGEYVLMLDSKLKLEVALCLVKLVWIVAYLVCGATGEEVVLHIKRISFLDLGLILCDMLL